MEDVFAGLQDAYAKLAANVQKTYGVPLSRVGTMGVSAMTVSYTHLRAHETVLDLVCRLLHEKKKI